MCHLADEKAFTRFQRRARYWRLVAIVNLVFMNAQSRRVNQHQYIVTNYPKFMTYFMVMKLAVCLLAQRLLFLACGAAAGGDGLVGQ